MKKLFGIMSLALVAILCLSYTEKVSAFSVEDYVSVVGMTEASILSSGREIGEDKLIEATNMSFSDSIKNSEGILQFEAGVPQESENRLFAKAPDSESETPVDLAQAEDAENMDSSDEQDETDNELTTLILEIGKSIFAFLGAVLLLLQIIHEAVYFLSPVTDNIFTSKYFSWKEVEKFADKIANQIQESEVNYGLIVGTGRGGGILAALLSYRLNLKPVLIFDRKYRIMDNNGVPQLTSTCNELKIEFDESFKSLLDEPVLLVTARSQAGVTLDKYIAVLRASGFKGAIDKCPFILSDDSNDKPNAKYYIATYGYGYNKKCREFPWQKDKPDIYKRTKSK